MHTDRCGNIRKQKCRAKGSGQEAKIQMNVGHELDDYTSNNWSRQNSNKG
jgi:hypothetical protein